MAEYSPTPPHTQAHAVKTAGIVFPVSPPVEARSEMGPSGKAQSPSDLSCFVTLNWDGARDWRWGQFHNISGTF